MKRYIVDKQALGLFGISTVNGTDKLSESILITNEGLHFENLKWASVVIDEETANKIKTAGLYIEEEQIRHNVCLADDYEKTRSFYYKKPVNQNLTGSGCRVGIIDTGCNAIGTRGVDAVWTEFDYSSNVVDMNPGVTDVYGHGTRTASIIKSSLGLAPDCELHVVKGIADDATTTESALLAAVDYCITNNLDIVNMSFTFDTTAFNSAVADLIANGTVVSASSGDSVTQTNVLSPAKLDNVVAVNSIKENGDPIYFNVDNGHGIDIACSGYSCETISKTGSVSGAYGSSFSSPYFTGAFALYKQKLHHIMNNDEIKKHILNKAIRTSNDLLFGNGILTF